MTQDLQDLEKETPEARNFSSGEESAQAEQTQNRRIVRIDAKPEPIAIDIAKTAAIVVDMQPQCAGK